MTILEPFSVNLLPISPHAEKCKNYFQPFTNSLIKSSYFLGHQIAINIIISNHIIQASWQADLIINGV